MNSEGSISQFEALITELVLPFYEVRRDMYLPLAKRRPENDAEHSWSLTFLACALAPKLDPSLNIGLIAQLATVHDLIEIYAGDASTWNPEALKTKEKKEQEALKTISQKFGEYPWIIETIEEYERKASKEAKYIGALDKVLALTIRHLDKGQFFVETGITKERFQTDLSGHRQKAHAHPAVGQLYEEVWQLFMEHPEFFAPEK